jgi:2-methylisocitrate lyase-like PEP mutase family enzyme
VSRVPVKRAGFEAVYATGGGIARSAGYPDLGLLPSDLQRAAIRAMQEALRVIARDGNSAALAERMASFTEREAIVGTDDYLERGHRYDG